MCTPRVHAEDGTWDVDRHTDPMVAQAFRKSIFRDGHIVHVEWSPYGPELAVIDESGRIAICGFSQTVNRIGCNPSGVIEPDPDEGLRSVVGMTWLPHMPKVGQRHSCEELNH